MKNYLPVTALMDQPALHPTQVMMLGRKSPFEGVFLRQGGSHPPLFASPRPSVVQHSAEKVQMFTNVLWGNQSQVGPGDAEQ